MLHHRLPYSRPFRRLACEAWQLAAGLEKVTRALPNNPPASTAAASHAACGISSHYLSSSADPSPMVRRPPEESCSVASTAFTAASASWAASALKRLYSGMEWRHAPWRRGDDQAPATSPSPDAQHSEGSYGGPSDWLTSRMALVFNQRKYVAPSVPSQSFIAPSATVEEDGCSSPPPPSLTPPVVSDMEKYLTNIVAARLGLPRRFLWPFAAATSADNAGVGESRVVPAPKHLTTPAHASLMLWPTAMRTAGGGTTPRPPSVSHVEASSMFATSLTALPTISTAREIFAPAAAPSVRKVTPIVAAELRLPKAVPPAIPADMSLTGGGVLYPFALEAYLVLLHTARTQALTRKAGLQNAYAGDDSATQLAKGLTLYCSDQCDALLISAAQLLGISQVRLIQTVAGKRELPVVSPPAPLPQTAGAAATAAVAAGDGPTWSNYAIDVHQLRSRLVEDVAAGLFPLMVVGTFGSGLSGAVDPLYAMGELCQRLGIWFHVDASHGGAALMAHPLKSAAPHDMAQRDSVLEEFGLAAQLSDSILVRTGVTTLPYAVLSPTPSATVLEPGDAAAGASALFVASIHKVAWSVQALGSPRQTTFNQWMTPGMADSDALRVTPLEHVKYWLARQQCLCTGKDVDSAAAKKPWDGNAAYMAQCRVPKVSEGFSHLACRVDRHQRFARAVLQRLRGDGRFDASLDATVFGLVHLRWLTAADEATIQLAHAWASVLAAEYQGNVSETPGAYPVAPRGVAVGASTTSAAPHASTAATASPLPPLNAAAAAVSSPLVPVHVGLVQLQRRVWIAVSFGALPCGPGDANAAIKMTTQDEMNDRAAKGSGNISLDALTGSAAVCFVLRTLDVAARAIRTDSTAELPTRC